MDFDYCEFESVNSNQMNIFAGCRFTDEPDDLYVVQLDALQDGTVQELKLYFNDHDCKYNFRPEELAAIKEYVLSVIASTEYADWFKGSLRL
ncbi:MAG: hypothetical protein K0S39_1739 [Paenibacillus sp.]|nr:hypothetical protein [Paenibacillus sp.]